MIEEKGKPNLSWLGDKRVSQLSERKIRKTKNLPTRKEKKRDTTEIVDNNGSQSTLFLLFRLCPAIGKKTRWKVRKNII